VANTTPSAVPGQTSAPPVVQAESVSRPPQSVASAPAPAAGDQAPAAGAAEPNSEAEPAQQLPPASVDWKPDQWLSIVDELPVSGMPLQLARNCVLVSTSGDTVHLQLDPEYESLTAPRWKERLRQKMSVYANGEVQLKVEVPKTLEGSTPAMAAKQAEQAKLEQARSAIADDPVVQEICKQFDGTVSTGSIKPIPSDGDDASE